MNKTVSKLDLTDYIKEFKSFFARDKELFLQGDISLHYKFINELSCIDFTPPKEVKNLNSELMHIKKSGHLKIYEIHEFVKIIEYFLYLKKLSFPATISTWLEKIIVPQEIIEVCNFFDLKGKLKDEIDERFLTINKALKNNKERIKESLRRVINSQKLNPYLVDKQIHYINDSETLLVRGGFNHVLKATVVSRSSAGYFYVQPDIIIKLKKDEAQLLSQKDELVYSYEKQISSIFYKFEPFLSFIDKAFDRFDNYQARVLFAKSLDLEFVKPSNNHKIKLSNFSHPALSNPKPISIDFSKKILLITGVNAGGKTMLLKSILATVFMAKYLLPMKIDSQNSSIGHFKEVVSIIDDPQNVKNDISTFAGRMLEFSKLFTKQNFIVGVDEIELGTDSDEAASLFKVILEELAQKNNKIIITTHHKRLASMMATHKEVTLAAALYDETNRKPTYDFLYGTVGKSYAFETALRYNIPLTLVKRAKKLYGEDKEKLGELIQKNIELELEKQNEIKKLQHEVALNKKLNQQLKDKKESIQHEIDNISSKLELTYKEAIQEAKKAAKSKTKEEIHKNLNKANKVKQEIKKIANVENNIKISVGDFVKYNNQKGKVLSIKKGDALIDSNGIKIRVPIKYLKKTIHTKNKKISKTTSITIQKPQRSSIQLDLHGLRSDEAIEKLDKYLSDVLLAGYDEVLIYHGVGTGKLAYAVKEFLKTHPSIKNFYDAPANMGGMGATIVRL